MQPHNLLVTEIIYAIQRRLGDSVRVFKRPVGLLMTQNGMPLKVGVNGQCDIYGYIRRDPYARPFEIEAKFGKDKLRDDQYSWQEVLRWLKVGHLVVVATSKDHINEAAEHAADYVEQLAGRGASNE